MSRPARPAAPALVHNPWRRLQTYTDARIGLGRAGVSLPTHELLRFQLAHAQARDAVHLPLDVAALVRRLEQAGWPAPRVLRSQARDRIEYLQRPDLGRRLHADDAEALAAHAAPPERPYDLALVIVDGLSSRAVDENALPFLQALRAGLQPLRPAWRLAPVTVVTQGRVAVGDEVGERLNARAVLVLIGERPGLSSPDSLGLYLTWAPRIGLSDADRNCISNVRPAGLKPGEAAHKAVYLLSEARRRRLSGVRLKDRAEESVIEPREEAGNFLIPSTKRVDPTEGASTDV